MGSTNGLRIATVASIVKKATPDPLSPLGNDRLEEVVLEHAGVSRRQCKGKCPYEHLGLKLASYDFWTLLKDEFATPLEEEKARAKAKLKARAA